MTTLDRTAASTASDPGAFAFAPIGAADLPLLREWLHRPHVARWWGEPATLADLEREYLPTIAGPSTTRAFIARDATGTPIGFIQSYVALGSGGGWWEAETDPGVRGIDQFLADGAGLGRGIGRAMIGAFVDRLFRDPAVTAVQTDPSPANERAIRCYRAAGFADVGVVVTPDGPALLMRCERAVRASAATRGRAFT